MTKTLTVALAERQYPIYIGKNLLNDAALLKQHIIADQVLLVTNETVAALYLEKIKLALHEKQCDIVILPDGEQYKTLTTLNKIFDELLANNQHRNITASYQRGVNFIQIPTSLLAQVDASIGGKTAVNHPLGKNMIGAFHQPQAVIIDTEVLKTLPAREFNAGLAEIIKAALIRDAKFFLWLEQNLNLLLQHEPNVLTEAIARACAIKAEIVAADEKELTGQRALLNFGHTLGHAVEQVLGYGTWLHGEAVAIGMVFAARVSQAEGWLTPAEVARIENILAQAQLPIQLQESLQYDKIITSMARDKKLQDAKLRLVLPKALGSAELVKEVDEKLIKQVFETLKQPR